ncbi:response regulator transcription factor [Brevundimonas sp. Root1423]|uniref:response regulator transcription factor n=1 Tax=Brevundimonas sp. Root1423 TaxID=1736462 RepID=UPI0006F5484A|nr:response regulator [Brevundimonas sp. Root1423]KQY85044.1 two-component system response regulator [Brevundimonas sp. Root1423]
MDASVFVIDDDGAVRDSLLALLRAQGVTARGFTSGSDFFERLPQAESACVITDVRMPGMDGSDVVRRLAELKGHAWPVIVITGHAEVPLAVQMMKAGVVDFIEKPFDPHRLIETVQGCLGLLAGRRNEAEARKAASERLDQLTPRERQVFDALVEGRSNKEIALGLEISPRTVEIFRAKVMTKMKANSLSSLVRMGLLLSGG